MQIARRLGNMHPDKLIHALQSHIVDGHEQAALQAIPDLQLQHPQLAPELEQIKAQLNKHLQHDVKLIDRAQAEIFRCSNCGAGLARQCPESVHVICHYCGCDDAEHPANEHSLGRWNAALDLEANFTLGDFFSYDGMRWQAVGVQVYSGTLSEYSDEGWERNRTRYTNWWMLNENRELAWLVDDGSKRYWAQKYIPDNPAVPSTGDKRHEHGDWRLEFAAGEFTYQPQPGEAHRSAEAVTTRVLPDASGKKTAYHVSVESRLVDNGGEMEVGEIEFVKSRLVPHEDVLRGLGKNIALADMFRWRNTSRLLMLALPLLLMCFLYFDRGGETISQTLPVNKTDNDLQMQQFKVDKVGTNMSFKSRVSGLQKNSWFGLNLALLSSDGETVYEKYTEYWRESGYDSEGAWSEADLSSSWFVRVDKADTYQVAISAAPSSATPAVKLKLQIEPGRVAMAPFVLGGFITVLLLMLCRSKISSVKSAASSIALKLNNRRGAAKPRKHNNAANTTRARAGK